MTLMTEDEARTKWCPFTRHAYSVGNLGVTSVNRGNFLEPNECRCIASECMAWRWHHMFAYPLNPDDTSSPTITPDTKGFCGLAHHKPRL